MVEIETHIIHIGNVFFFFFNTFRLNTSEVSESLMSFQRNFLCQCFGFIGISHASFSSDKMLNLSRALFILEMPFC